MLEQQAQLAPTRELVTPDGYRWFTYSANQVGLPMVCLEDLATGTVVTTTEANPTRRVAAHRAWEAARHSRSAGEPWEIAHEMGVKGVDPDQKVEKMFSTYGHASVGDLARPGGVHLVGVPMHFCAALFNNTPVGSGQEKSTRFQGGFGGAPLQSMRHYLPEDVPLSEAGRLEAGYQSLGELSLQLFAQARERVGAAFTDYFQPDAAQLAGLGSRALDCARFFLLFGQCTGMSLETSARDWSRMIADLKASPIRFYNRVGAQIERLLAPGKEEEEALDYKAEAPGLIRHTGAARTTNNNLSTLRSFIEGKTDLLGRVGVNRSFKGAVGQDVELVSKDHSEAADRMVAQYLLTLWPGLGGNGLLEWVTAAQPELKRSIGEIIFAGHDNYIEPSLLARTTDMTLVVKGFLGELRDLNRHRAWGRFLPLPLIFGEPLTRDTLEQILAKGFGLPAYLTHIPEFAYLGREFTEDFVRYYERLYRLVDAVYGRYGNGIDYSFAVNLLPLAHQVDLWMHGDPKQALYLTRQRVRPAGHINYRLLAYQANRLIADSNPYLTAMGLDKEPDPASREEFFNRS